MNLIWDGLRAWHGGAEPSWEPASDVALIETNRKSQIIRFPHSREAESTVIGKRARSDVVALEGKLYREVLPAIGVASPRYFGSAQSELVGRSWLFMEEVVGKVFQPTLPDHVEALSEAVAALHAQGSNPPACGRLPSRDVSYLLGLVEAQRQKLLGRYLGNKESDPSRLTLGRLLCLYDEVIDQWADYGAILGECEPVLTHGDLASENIIIRERGGSIEVVIIDWEKAGVGPAAIDLPHVDLIAYMRVNRQQSSLKALLRQKHLGTFLRAATRRLHRKPPKSLSEYADLMEAALLGVDAPARSRIATRIPAELASTDSALTPPPSWGDRAVAAWLRLYPAHIPVRADEVKVRPPRTVVVKLHMQDGTVVCGKASSESEGQREKDVYRHVLSKTLIPAPALLGTHREDSDTCEWLFLEHLPNVAAPPKEVARALGRAGAQLHNLGRLLVDTVDLPRYDIDAHRHILTRADATVSSLFAPSGPKAEEQLILHTIRDSCAYLDHRWSAVTGILDTLPQTLVHGDVAPKNARFQYMDDSLECTLIDWASAGWGVPALDLPFVDLPSYHAHLRLEEARPSWQDLVAVQELGYVLWLLRAVSWEGWDGNADSDYRRLKKLRFYSDELAQSLRSVLQT